MAGTLRIAILADAANAVRGLRQTGDEAERAGKKAGGVGKVFGGLKGILAGGFALAGVGALGDMFGDAYEGAREAAKISAVLNAQLKNMGPSARSAFSDADSFASSFGNSIGKDDDDVKAVIAKLSTFPAAFGKGSDGADAMHRATKAAFDLEAMGIGKADSNIIGLGKALNNPIKGLSALSKQGVSFTAEQQDQIKNYMKQGKLGEAQKVLLKGIESNAKGAATAAATPMDRLKATMGNMSEGLVGKLLPFIDKAATWVTTKLIPGFEKVGGWLGKLKLPSFAGAGSGLTKIGGLLKSVFQSKEFTSIFTKIKAGFDSLAGPVNKFIAVAKPIATEVMGFLAAKFQQYLPQIKSTLTTIGDIFSSVFEVIRVIVTVAVTVLSFIWTNFGTQIKNVLGAVFGAIVGILKGAFTIVKGIWDVIVGLLTGDWGRAWNGVKSILSGAWLIIKSVFNVMKAYVALVLAIIWKGITATWNGIKSATSAVWNGIKNFFVGIWNGIKGVASAAWNGLKSGIAAAWNWIKGVTASAWNGYKNLVSAGVNAAVHFVKEIPGKVKAALSNAASWLLNVGRDIMNGLVSGLNAGKQWVINKVAELANLIPGPIKKILGIKSPSKVMKELGAFVVKGFVQGLTGSASDVSSTSAKLASLVTQAFGKRSGLAGRVARDTKQLAKDVKKRDALTARLAAAQDKLSGLVGARADIVSSVVGQVRDSFHLIGDAEEGAPNTMDAIVNRARDAVRQATSFAASLATLKRRGLNPKLLNELAMAGPAAGLETAAALTRGSEGELAELNAQFAKLANVADTAGNTVGDAMYRSGIQAAQGLVNGLNAQRKSIEATMLRIAQGMQAAIKRALGIRSPSRVFHSIGMSTVEGFADGFQAISGRSLVGTFANDLRRQAPKLQRAVSALSPTIGVTAEPISAGAVRSTAQPTLVTVNQYLHPTSDPVEVGRQTVKAIRAWEQTMGRTVLA